MNLREAAAQALGEPYPSHLWQLRGALLEDGASFVDPSMILLDSFYQFLNELTASSTAREYSHFASILDMTAVAGVAMQNLVAERDSDGWVRRFLLGAVSEGMMVLAARQYVKAWEEEMQANYHSAAWFLQGAFWRISADLQPDLAVENRRILVDNLVEPLISSDMSGTEKAALIIRYYQLLLLARLAPMLAGGIDPGQ